MPLFASFQFPPLQKSQPGCLWARPTRLYSHLSEFAIRLPRPSDLNYINDQVVTFRLEGKVRGKSEKLQGVILVSRLRDIMGQAVVQKSAKVAASAPKLQTNIDPNPHIPPAKVDSQNLKPAVPSDDVVSINWEDWSDAVSLHPSKSSTVLEPRYTQVANLARSKKDKTRAVMIIRDYNQQTLHAPTGFMTRNLGHPTENRDPEVKSEFKDYIVKPFQTVIESKSIDTILFGNIRYGLGHRMRMIDLGEYTHNTATSMMFWDASYMGVVPSTPDVRDSPDTV